MTKSCARWIYKAQDTRGSFDVRHRPSRISWQVRSPLSRVSSQTHDILKKRPEVARAVLFNSSPLSQHSKYLTSLLVPPYIVPHGKGRRFSSMTHQARKKRNDDETMPSDTGQKPIQLQRRRVWRACESCRSVCYTAYS